ncbi:MAG: thioredoxin domain-containing protein [Rhodospirillales bacterium]|nr:thioredoxin domain-containing protein [Rhodospirillales bacterium]
MSGDVTLVEFFDYNCGFCKRALPDLSKLIDRESKLRVVLKELPILSKGSELAARVALAARKSGQVLGTPPRTLCSSRTSR